MTTITTSVTISMAVTITIITSIHHIASHRTSADLYPPTPNNEQVIKLMQSFTSKELVKEQFSWRYYYWYLTNEGIEYLREYLNLSADVVPNTLKKSTRPPTRPMADERGPRREGGDRGGGRDGYRSERPGGFGRGGDKAGPGGNFKPQFA